MFEGCRFNFYVFPKDISKRRFYTVRICKCPSQMSKLDHCGNTECLAFKVSWNKDLDKVQQLKAFRWLWYAFEVAPKSHVYNNLSFRLSFDRGMSDSSEQPRIQEFFNQHFQKAYNEVFEATEDSESSATSDESFGASKINWHDEEELWRVYRKKFAGFAKS
eukprot:GHVP01013357.1.p1 GENE.GHVP01013357.1~~GHVP01013357.1.p1  ORF type:complete len:162 (-),score=22.52 GHVP01013357.1:790-1275(-)